MSRAEILSDLSLAQRLESAEGTAGARYVDAHARMMPEAGVEWIQVGGTYAMFDGPDSPITQTFGLGMREIPTADDMERLESFFLERGSGVHHEVSPMADTAVMQLLNSRGYQPEELTSVLYLPLDSVSLPPGDPKISVKIAGSDEEKERWAVTAAEGWREFEEIDRDFMLQLMRIGASRDDAPCFLAELENAAVAAGGLAIHEGVALLAGASTIPEWRQRGAQQALLKARLNYAKDQGCDLAMICTAPGSGSQRNAQRQGFRIAYTRIKWKLNRPS